MIINLSNVEVTSKEYLTEDGEYEVKIENYELGLSQNKGTPFVKFEAKTDKDQYIKFTFYLTDSSMWKFKKFLMTVGHTGEGNIDPEVVAKQCVGQPLKIVCTHPTVLNPVTQEKETGKYLEVVNFKKC